MHKDTEILAVMEIKEKNKNHFLCKLQIKNPSNYKEFLHLLGFLKKQITGIEPASSAWEADILPMNYICLLIFANKYYITHG